MVEDKRIELLLHACKAIAFPITPIPQLLYLVSVAGIEPTLYRPKRQVIPFHQRGIWYQELDSNQPHLVLQTSALPDELSWHCIGLRYEDRTRDSGITTRGFTTKLTSTLIGRTGEIRTPNLKFRRLAFYPIELRSDYILPYRNTLSGIEPATL